MVTLLNAIALQKERRFWHFQNKANQESCMANVTVKIVLIHDKLLSIDKKNSIVYAVIDLDAHYIEM